MHNLLATNYFLVTIARYLILCYCMLTHPPTGRRRLRHLDTIEREGRRCTGDRRFGLLGPEEEDEEKEEELVISIEWTGQRDGWRARRGGRRHEGVCASFEFECYFGMKMH